MMMPATNPINKTGNAPNNIAVVSSSHDIYQTNAVTNKIITATTSLKRLILYF